VATAALSALLEIPLSVVRGAFDAVKYAQAFVTRAPSEQAGLRADDDERELIFEEELERTEPTPRVV
jgi:hypothetical protein